MFSVPSSRDERCSPARTASNAAAAAQTTANRYWGVETNLLLSREQARRGDADAVIGCAHEDSGAVDIQEQSIRDPESAI
jgi:hypothetical protein